MEVEAIGDAVRRRENRSVCTLSNEPHRLLERYIPLLGALRALLEVEKNLNDASLDMAFFVYRNIRRRERDEGTRYRGDKADNWR